MGRPPVVAVTGFNMPAEMLTLMGAPYFPSLLPHNAAGAHGGQPMSFRERVRNTYTWLANTIYRHWVYRPALDAIIAEVSTVAAETIHPERILS